MVKSQHTATTRPRLLSYPMPVDTAFYLLKTKR